MLYCCFVFAVCLLFVVCLFLLFCLFGITSFALSRPRKSKGEPEWTCQWCTFLNRSSCVFYYYRKKITSVSADRFLRDFCPNIDLNLICVFVSSEDTWENEPGSGRPRSSSGNSETGGEGEPGEGQMEGSSKGTNIDIGNLDNWDSLFAPKTSPSNKKTGGGEPSTSSPSPGGEKCLICGQLRGTRPNGGSEQKTPSPARAQSSGSGRSGSDTLFPDLDMKSQGGKVH